jgi:S-DNA-T family DNA segregation ATPase FtsK/SpoIIIE
VTRSPKEGVQAGAGKTPYRKLELVGIVLVALAVFLSASYFGLSTGSVGAFLNKILRYALGLGALFAPLVLFVLGAGLILAHRNLLFSWGALAAAIFIVCVLGLIHHVFVPMGEELIPEQLPAGGGLIGGLLLMVLRKAAGSVGALLLLCAGILVSIVLTGKISLRSSAVKAGDSFKRITSHKIFSPDYEEETEATESSPELPETGTTAAEQPNVYEQDEFADYTEGIKKPGLFKHILNFGQPKETTVTVPVESLPAEPDSTAADRKPLTPVYQEKPEIVVLRPRTVEIPGEGAASGKTAGPVIKNFDDEVEAAAGSTACMNGTAVPDKTVEMEATVSSGSQEADSTAKNARLENGTTPSHGKKKSSGYRLPPLSLLKTVVKPRSKDYEADIQKQCAILEQTLADFKVHAEVVHVTRGPSVTRFELEPAPGVKVSSVVNLADDIALRLAASGVRIEAPIPGKAAIGIEAPNIKTEPVTFKEVVDCKELRGNTDKLCVGLGRDIAGNVICCDLSKMPHLLVAGSTGSGKSVCINTIIAGILYKALPDEVKFILVDPKVVELTNYNGIPHLLVPVVTDPKKAASALHWAVAEMERRYKVFADNHVRDMTSYNKQAEEPMPYIVIIIDELSDLMMVAKVDVEDAILRLAQKARAAGIHLVLATQRPSVDVITGIVKANIPSRIAFAVSSQIDSRTILDETGAEKLLGKGDMLYSPIGTNKPVRVQGAFVTDEELNKIVSFIKDQELPVEYSEEVTAQTLASENGTAEKSGQDNLTGDELFADALRLVLDVGQASSSMLQRRFRIGYTRAARLVDCMEQLGIVGPAAGSKPRQLIMNRADVEAKFLTKG